MTSFEEAKKMAEEAMKANPEMAAEVAKMQEQATQGALSGDAAADTTSPAEVERLNRVGNSGLDGECTLDGIKETGETDVSGNKEYALDVTVELPGQDAFKTTSKMHLLESNVDFYKKGARFKVKADPDDTSYVLVREIID
jgi:hypothetical protein